MASRYEGKPLLRLVELYVLWAISEISPQDEQRLHEMTPQLQSLYGIGESWHEIIASVVKMPSDAPEALRGMWLRNLELARQNDLTLAPQQFAEMVADQNFQ